MKVQTIPDTEQMLQRTQLFGRRSTDTYTVGLVYII